MHRYLFLSLLLLLPFLLMAQNGNINGKVVTAPSKLPVAKASIFLSNATYGTVSSDDGTYNLRNIKPGQYDLVVTTLGFEEFTKKVTIGTSQNINLDIELTPKAIMLRGVVISSNADWKKNYEQFKRDFIGTNDNAKDCKVVNPRILDLIYHRNTQSLEASADEFLVVENHSLGYRVKFLLNNFNSSNITHTIQYSGRVLFEELPGSESQKKKWKLKREDAYYGSPQQFYRSLYQNTLTADGFIIYDFTRNLNPQRLSEELIQRKLKQFRMVNRDSMNYWINQQGVPKWANEILRKPPMTGLEILRKAPQEGIYAITFPHYLYVVYTKKHEETDFRDVYHPLDMENFETSVITLYKPFYAVFDRNGTVIAENPLYEGTWSKAKLANLLPIDYEPGE